jgi:hypothetical protein
MLRGNTPSFMRNSSSLFIFHLLQVHFNFFHTSTCFYTHLDLDFDLGVNKDVVDVQLHVGNLLVRIDSGTNCGNWGKGGPSLDVLDGESGGGTLASSGGGLLLNSELQEQVTGGGKQDVALLLNVDGNVTLSVGNANGCDGKSGVLVEPKYHINP